MFRSAAGLTLFFAFFVNVAFSKNLNPSEDSCAKCRTFVTSETTTRSKYLSGENGDLLKNCIQECRYLFSDETVKQFYVEQQKQEDDSQVLRLESLKRQGPGRYIINLLKYYIYKLFIFFRGIFGCALRNTVTVVEATLDLPPGYFRMRRCEKLDLAEMGVSAFYIKLLKSISRLLLPKLRGEIPDGQLKNDLFMADITRDFLEASNINRIQKRAIQQVVGMK